MGFDHDGRRLHAARSVELGPDAAHVSVALFEEQRQNTAPRIHEGLFNHTGRVSAKSRA